MSELPSVRTTHMPQYDDLEPDWEELALDVVPPSTGSEKAIEKAFQEGRLRVVQDRNDFFLPHVVDFIRVRRWGNLRPEYQRRLRWDDKKKSKLIESFIMNVPVPPVFLYEGEIGSFEVMDGQQRLNAIVEFFENEFELAGLQIWPSLNGRSFSQLPPLLKRGLERSKISAITLMADPSSGKDSIDLRAQVFDRLNRGGERLNPQEIRNSLYSGDMNRLSIELSALPDFTDAWEIPNREKHTLSDKSISKELQENKLYQRMMDCEIVLRFFAFRQPKEIAGSVRGMLDRTLRDNRKLTEKVANECASDFKAALSLARGIFGGSAFRLPPTGDQLGPLSRPVYDAEMVASHLLAGRREELLKSKAKVSAAVFALAKPGVPSYELMIGRGNTAQSVKDRIELVKTAMEGAL